jgi:hypothetical protein
MSNLDAWHASRRKLLLMDDPKLPPADEPLKATPEAPKKRSRGGAKYLPLQKAANALLDADLIGLSKAATKYRVSVSRLSRWRRMLTSNPQLSEVYQDLREKTFAQIGEVRKTVLVRLLLKIDELAQNARIDNLSHLINATKVIADLDQTDSLLGKGAIKCDNVGHNASMPTGPRTTRPYTEALTARLGLNGIGEQAPAAADVLAAAKAP